MKLDAKPFLFCFLIGLVGGELGYMKKKYPNDALCDKLSR
ncbi:Uncharacterised protein [Listeria newyorkensis]|nr:hypothetical protein X559_2091 [Listeria newyorkensis]SQC56395.1 Uncharacterised protein [Listeria newyorkensis]